MRLFVLAVALLPVCSVAVSETSHAYGKLRLKVDKIDPVADATDATAEATEAPTTAAPTTVAATTVAVTTPVRTFEAEKAYLFFRYKRLQGRLARGKKVLSNLEARETYVQTALQFQTFKATEMVERAAADHQELQKDHTLLTALSERVPGLNMSATNVLPGQIERYKSLVDTLRGNISSLLESDVWTQLTEINKTLNHASEFFTNLNATLDQMEYEIAPWKANFSQEAEHTSRQHLDGLLLKVTDNLAQTIEKSTDALAEPSEREEGDAEQEADEAEEDTTVAPE